MNPFPVAKSANLRTVRLQSKNHFSTEGQRKTREEPLTPRLPANRSSPSARWASTPPNSISKS